MKTRALIDTYYAGLAKRAGWDAAVDDDFEFVGGTAGVTSRGKAAYAEVLRQFFRMFETVAVKEAVVDGNHACVIATYDAVSPAGRKRAFDIAEVWTARDGRLAALAIYFDTAGWKAFMAG